MRPHFWLEFTDKRKLLAFTVITAAILLYWNLLLPGVLGKISHDKRLIALTIFIHEGWFFGWGIALFGKAEDLNVLTDYDFDRLRKIASNALIIAAMLGFTATFIIAKSS